jgi:5S rRNA maturation endonuclease (ribonuclease M5)
MDHKKSLEEINDAIKKLRKENEKIPILVEGEKDVDALRSLGINGKILTINYGKSISNFCDDLADRYKGIIILTDLDRKGGRLCRSIQKNLEGRVKCMTKFRDTFSKFAAVKNIEGLPTYLKNLDAKLNI